MIQENEDPVLPYTPTNTGRRARVGYLGFDGVDFNDLWPLFAGLIASIALAIRFFIGGKVGGHWLLHTLAAGSPFLAGFGYLRCFVVGRPPHFRGDLWAAAAHLRLDAADPRPRFLPLLPRVFVDGADACGPERAADLVHPVRRRRARPGPNP